MSTPASASRSNIGSTVPLRNVSPDDTSGWCHTAATHFVVIKDNCVFNHSISADPGAHTTAASNEQFELSMRNVHEPIRAVYQGSDLFPTFAPKYEKYAFPPER